MIPPTINAIFADARNGDEAATTRLFEFLTARFRLIAHQRIWNSGDVDEVVQDALAVLVAEYRTVEITSSFAAWAYKILDYKILCYIQAKRRRAKHAESQTEDDLPDDGVLGGCNPDLKRRLIFCLRKLGTANMRYARVINLAHLGYNTDEICRRLDLKRATFYSLLSRARTLLMACLEKGDAD